MYPAIVRSVITYGARGKALRKTTSNTNNESNQAHKFATTRPYLESQSNELARHGTKIFSVENNLFTKREKIITYH